MLYRHQGSVNPKMRREHGTFKKIAGNTAETEPERQTTGNRRIVTKCISQDVLSYI